MAESEEELKSLLMEKKKKEPLDEGKGGKWKNWLKTKYLKN